MMIPSVWGETPSRFYRLIRCMEQPAGNSRTACVVGCSDGKFVLPLLRRGYAVTCYDLDEIALFGGKKVFPFPRSSISKPPYESIMQADSLPNLPSEIRSVSGLVQRIHAERLEHLAEVRHADFYRSPPGGLYDLVFTSCSMQYKFNQDLPITSLITTLQNHVAIGGTLAVEYMLPLEDCHTWKAAHFLRTGQMKTFFAESHWAIAHCHEARRPLFEAAHVDRPQDHYHRFGYLHATRKRFDG